MDTVVKLVRVVDGDTCDMIDLGFDVWVKNQNLDSMEWILGKVNTRSRRKS